MTIKGTQRDQNLLQRHTKQPQRYLKWPQRDRKRLSYAKGSQKDLKWLQRNPKWLQIDQNKAIQSSRAPCGWVGRAGVLYTYCSSGGFDSSPLLHVKTTTKGHKKTRDHKETKIRTKISKRTTIGQLMTPKKHKVTIRRCQTIARRHKKTTE